MFDSNRAFHNEQTSHFLVAREYSFLWWPERDEQEVGDRKPREKPVSRDDTFRLEYQLPIYIPAIPIHLTDMLSQRGLRAFASRVFFTISQFFSVILLVLPAGTRLDGSRRYSLRVEGSVIANERSYVGVKQCAVSWNTRFYADLSSFDLLVFLLFFLFFLFSQ